MSEGKGHFYHILVKKKCKKLKFTLKFQIMFHRLLDKRKKEGGVDYMSKTYHFF